MPILRAGPILADYEAASLRSIRCGGVEVLRRIYFAVRDPQWNTPPPQIVSETIHQGPDSFQIDLEVEHHLDSIDYAWTGRIEGHADGSLRFTVSGTARSEFPANRIGLCILHPIQRCAGRECLLEHVDGSREASRFPRLVAPHQPFLNLRAITHEPAPGFHAQVRVEGDTFETEDQRNWSDDSFKTYSRPLELPKPYPVQPGDRTDQSVTVTFDGIPPQVSVEERPVHLSIQTGERAPFPRIRFERIELHLGTSLWREELARGRSGEPQECAIFTTGTDGEVAALAEELKRTRPAILRWLIFDEQTQVTSARLDAFRQALAPLYPGVPVGGGSNANFAELNRNRDAAKGLDFVSWPINPQVHAVDARTLVENLRAQRWTVETARSFCGDLPIHISPVTIPVPLPAAAAWIVGSIDRLAEAGVQGVTYRDIQGAATVRALLEDFQPTEVMSTSSSNPLAADGLALRNGTRTRLLLVNFLDREQEIEIEGAGRETVGPYAIRTLDLTLD